jgi:STE24 endopeptidase
MDSKKYNRIKLAAGIAKGVITFILIFLFVYSGYSLKLENYIAQYFSNQYLLFISFVFVTGAAAGIIFFPLSYYIEFHLEHKYNLSNQTIWKWIKENLKGLAVAAVIGIPILVFFFYSLNKFGTLWWLPFAIGLFFISVILAKIVPVLILPLFYKISPIDDEDLKERIERLCKDAGIKLKDVYKFDMSRNTKKANAAFTGLGKSKRILLGDTLLSNFTNDEIETVIAHELGHYKKKHIIKNIIIGTASSFLTLFLIASLYKLSIGWFGFESITLIAAVPLLSLWGMLIGIVQTPLMNILSRKYEYEADEYAVVASGKPSAFLNTLEKLSDQNLADKNPHPFIEWFFYSHPSIKNRSGNVLEVAGKNNLHIDLSSENLNFERG